jgi:formamidopyrimidine-DNA glycosylase
MPELAEVEYFRKQWDAGLNRRISRVTIHPWTRLYRDCPAEDIAVALPGCRITSSETHGKQMLFRTDKDGWLGIHLGMTGALSHSDRSDFDDRYAHLVLQFDGGVLIFNDPRQFGRVRFETNPNAPSWWADLPPQVLSKAYTFDYISPFLDRRKGSLLKPILLMQDIFPGVGNWMADEILWRSRLAPSRRVKSLSDTERKMFYEQVRWVSRNALRIVGNDWGDFPDSWLFNHRWKDGGICPKTKKQLRRETIGGRTTCWSPAWQR